MNIHSLSKTRTLTRDDGITNTLRPQTQSWNINWHWKTPKKTNTKTIHIEKLKDEKTKAKYQPNVENRIKDNIVYENKQVRWNEVTKACTEAPVEVLRYEEKKKTTRVTTHQ